MPYSQLQQPYVLPVASTSTLGGIKTDGTVTTLNASNQLQINKNALLAGSGTNAILIGAGNNAAAQGDNSIGIGTQAYTGSANDIAIGNGAYADAGIAIGYNADTYHGGIQIGTGSTTSSNDFQVTSYKLLDLSTGLIPAGRIPAATTSTVGGVKIDGSSITISNGVISATNPLASVAVVANSGKFLKIDSTGAVIAEELPIYNGGVS